MDAQTRHWYLQQMGIPVWLPRGSEDLADAPAEDQIGSSAATSAGPAASPSDKAALGATQAPPSTATESSALSPAQQIAQSLRAGTPLEVNDQAITAATEVAFWLVLPNIADAQRPEAEALLDKVLAAVEVDKSQCYLLWAMPTHLPPASVKHLWCFGLQAPPGLAAKALELPSLSDMLSNVDAKRAAWNALKAAMPFNS